jgi:hypothetical protein
VRSALLLGLLLLFAILNSPSLLWAAPAPYVYSDRTNFYTYGPGVTNNLGPVLGLVGGALFSGSGSTGTVTSAAGDAGKYLKADGTWATPTDTTGGNVYTTSNNTYSGGTAQSFDQLSATNLNMRGNISLNGNWLSGDGGNEGLQVDSSGLVWVRTNAALSSAAPLTIIGVGAGVTYQSARAGGASGGTPTNTPASTAIGGLFARPFGTTNWAAGTRAGILFQTTELSTDTAQGAQASIQVTPNTTIVSITPMTWQHNGCTVFSTFATFPSDPVTGSTMMHSVSNKLFTWDGSAWKAHW